LGQLNIYLNDCENIYSKIENTDYKKKSLTELFKNYYECLPSDLTFQKEVEKTQTEIGVLAGFSITSLEFSGVIFPYLTYANYTTSMNPTGGIFFEFILPRNRRKWSIYNEFLFTNYKVSGIYEEYTSENFYTITTSEIGYSYLKMNNMVRYKFPIGKMSLFLNGGISNGLSVKETNYKRKESRVYSTDRIVEELAVEYTRKHEQGFTFGTGVKYNRFSLEIRFDRGNGMSNYASLKSVTKKYCLILGCRF